MVDGRRGDAVVVVGDLARVQRHPQPDPRPGVVRPVVPVQRDGERGGQELDEEPLRDLRRGEDEDTVAAVVGPAVPPRDAGVVERPVQRAVEPRAQRQPVWRRPALIAVALDVHGEDRPVQSRLFVPHRTLLRSCMCQCMCR